MTTQISNSQIEALRIEAGQAGDSEVVAACDTALGNRTADAWWMWHDKDKSRASVSMNKAEARCAAWVAGKSDDGPEQDEARKVCADAIEEAWAMGDGEA